MNQKSHQTEILTESEMEGKEAHSSAYSSGRNLEEEIFRISSKKS